MSRYPVLLCLTQIFRLFHKATFPRLRNCLFMASKEKSARMFPSMAFRLLFLEFHVEPLKHSEGLRGNGPSSFAQGTLLKVEHALYFWLRAIRFPTMPGVNLDHFQHIAKLLCKLPDKPNQRILSLLSREEVQHHELLSGCFPFPRPLSLPPFASNLCSFASPYSPWPGGWTPLGLLANKASGVVKCLSLVVGSLHARRLDSSSWLPPSVCSFAFVEPLITIRFPFESHRGSRLSGSTSSLLTTSDSSSAL